MGAWGTAIFSDDLTCDIRDTFRDHLVKGLSADAATGLIIKEYQSSIKDPEEGPTFWIGLAATQWKLGRLLPEIKGKALAVLEQGGDLARWEDSGANVAKRRKVLDKLKLQLESPPPSPKKLKAPYLDSTDWPIGAILAYRQPNEKYCLIRVVDHYKSSCGVSPVVDIFAWRGTEIPTMQVIEKMKMIRGGRSLEEKIGPIVVIAGNAKDCPNDRLHIVGIQTKPMPWQKAWTTSRANSFTNWRVWDRYSSGVLSFALGD